MTGLAHALAGLLRRDLLLAFRHRGELANPPLFFALIVTLYPLGVTPDAALLKTIAPGVIWIAALLAALFSLENLFRSDFDDGALEQLILCPHSLALLAATRVFGHWLISGLPLILLAPLLAIQMGLSAPAIAVLEATLLLGTPLLSLIGAIGVALTVGLRRGGVLLTLLVLPLYIPVLIFATSAVAAAASGLPVDGPLYFLAALLALGITLAPPAIASALRLSVN